MSTQPRTSIYDTIYSGSCVEIEFSSEEWDRIVIEAQKRHNTYYKDGSNVFEDSRTISDTEEQTVVALAGEAALSKHAYGTLEEMNTEIWEDEGDSGEDIELPDGQVVDVKATQWGEHRGKTSHLLVGAQNHWKHKETTDLYVLAVVDITQKTVKLKGYVEHEDVDVLGEWKNDGETVEGWDGTTLRMRNNNYVLHPAQLQHIEYLC